MNRPAALDVGVNGETPDVQTSALVTVADAMAEAVPRVDAAAEHERWQPGIGPFEEREQIELLVDELPDGEGYSVDREVTYPGSRRRCDLVIRAGGVRVPVEAKLLRFRLDNGNVDTNRYSSVFSPFPEEGSSSLLNDVRKLRESGFDLSGGLFGLYYEARDEPYDELDADRLGEKFVRDADHWYDADVRLRRVAEFDGLRHPHHQRGAVIAWEVVG